MYFERIVFEAYHTSVEGRTHRYFVEAPDILTHVAPNVSPRSYTLQWYRWALTITIDGRGHK